MCRAVWVILVAADPAVAARMRRAAGPEVQVVDVVGAAADLDERTEADVVIVDATSAGPDGLEAVRVRLPRAAVLWVGPDAPAAAQHEVPYDDDLEQALPGAITKALIARNTTGRDP